MRPLFFLLRFNLTVIFTIAIYNLPAQEYFNRIVPTEFGNVNPAEIIEFNDQFLITGIYGNTEGNTASVIIKADGSLNFEYSHFNEFAFTVKSLVIINEEILFVAKDRGIQKGSLNGIFNNNLSVFSIDTINTPGTSNFPTNICSVSDASYSAMSYTENDKKKFLITKYNSLEGRIWDKYYEENIGYSALWKLIPSNKV